MSVESWAVVEDGAVIEAHGADRLVPWWSFSKTVLASAALVLVEKGLLHLDEPLNGKPYTLRNLLQHRSGLPDYGWFRSYHDAVARGDEPWSVSFLLEETDAERLRYVPEEGWDYSNIGYLFVRQIIENATGQGLGSALRDLVFDPLDIRSAKVAMETRDLNDIAMGTAQGYHPGWVYHGLLVGSIADTALLLHRLMSDTLLKSETLQQMQSAHALGGPIEGRSWHVPGYGLGMMKGETTTGKSVAGHTGGGPGSTVAIYHSLSAKRTSAVFATSEDAANTERKAFDLL
ncbi:beta-lactamase family protein [Microvirga sp. ACRRW]|uniref:serine hydrolase domain-containing protein n=1 Tax=Microvirga sp. ACRRW TaxID=2918205 RepID=UPI001EF4F19B|nr:beta-lactamase family protein [Microvirga sp. ACRRW]